MPYKIRAYSFSKESCYLITRKDKEYRQIKEKRKKKKVNAIL